MKTKAEILANALNLSAEELTEVGKIRDHIDKILEKDLILNHVKAGFSFLEVSVYTNFADYTYRIMQNGTTYIHSTIIGFIQITSEVGEVLLNMLRNKQENNEYINLTLLPL